MKFVVMGLLGTGLAGAVCAATIQDSAPSAADVLSVLSRHSGAQLMSVAERVSRKDNLGTWYVEGYTAGKASTVHGLCERTSVAALIRRSEGARGAWKVIEGDQDTVIALDGGDSDACDKLPAAAFFGASDQVRVSDCDLGMLINAVKQIQPCARQRDDCNIRITGTPWSLLDRMAGAHVSIKVSSIDRDPNRSSDTLLWYLVDFSIDDSGKMYGANVRIVDGYVKAIDIFEIVR
jgi:hypothetical protein